MTILKKCVDLASRFILRKKQAHLKKHSCHNYSNKSPRPWSSRRLVLIDGTDVATRSGKQSTFSVADLERCLDKLSASNETYAIVPQFRLKNAYSSDNRRLQNLQSMRKVIITPGKTLNNAILTCNPRAFLLDIAKEFNAAIVSNDEFNEERSLDPGKLVVLRYH